MPAQRCARPVHRASRARYDGPMPPHRTEPSARAPGSRPATGLEPVEGFPPRDRTRPRRRMTTGRPPQATGMLRAGRRSPASTATSARIDGRFIDRLLAIVLRWCLRSGALGLAPLVRADVLCREPRGLGDAPGAGRRGPGVRDPFEDGALCRSREGVPEAARVGVGVERGPAVAGLAELLHGVEGVPGAAGASRLDGRLERDGLERRPRGVRARAPDEPVRDVADDPGAPAPAPLEPASADRQRGERRRLARRRPVWVGAARRGAAARPRATASARPP